MTEKKPTMILNKIKIVNIIKKNLVLQEVTQIKEQIRVKFKNIMMIMILIMMMEVIVEFQGIILKHKKF